MNEFARLQHALSELSPVVSVTPVDMLQLPDELGGPMRKMMRSGLTADELGHELGVTEEEGGAVAEILVEKGYLRREPAGAAADARYFVKFARMRGRPIPLDL